MDRMAAFPAEELVAFATDPAGRIVGWSAGAERLLGYRAHEVHGRTCADALDGRDELGNKFILPSWPLRSFAPAPPTPQDFLLDLTAADGRTLRADVGVFSLRDVAATSLMLLHVIRAAVPIYREPSASR